VGNGIKAAVKEGAQLTGRLLKHELRQAKSKIAREAKSKFSIFGGGGGDPSPDEEGDGEPAPLARSSSSVDALPAGAANNAGRNSAANNNPTDGGNANRGSSSSVVRRRRRRSLSLDATVASRRRTGAHDDEKKRNNHNGTTSAAAPRDQKGAAKIEIQKFAAKLYIKSQSRKPEATSLDREMYSSQKDLRAPGVRNFFRQKFEKSNPFFRSLRPNFSTRHYLRPRTKYRAKQQLLAASPEYREHSKREHSAAKSREHFTEEASAEFQHVLKEMTKRNRLRWFHARIFQENKRQENKCDTYSAHASDLNRCVRISS
jgi:hypothetical protein